MILKLCGDVLEAMWGDVLEAISQTKSGTKTTFINILNNYDIFIKHI